MKKNIVMQSINVTLKDPKGQEWLNGIYKKVSSEGGTGSYLPKTQQEVQKAICEADWEVETTRTGDRPSAVLVARGINGFFNMRSLADLPDDTELVVAKYHGNKPQLGWVSDDYAGTPTDELRAVCGTDQDGNGTFLITVFPGPDVAPESIEAPEELLGKVITVAEAKAFGASYCKVVTTAATKAALAE